MVQIDDDTFSHHLEVAISGATPTLLDGLADTDRSRRHAAAADLARYLADHLGCFDIQDEDGIMRPPHHPSLFADLGPLG